MFTGNYGLIKYHSAQPGHNFRPFERYREKYIEGLRLVHPESPKRVRKAVYEFAGYFRSEFSYDFRQFALSDPEDDKTFAYLFLKRSFHYDELYCGAVCFRWLEYKDHPHKWAMQWIYLHPYDRSNGLLTTFFPFFIQKYGNFDIEPPLSKAMYGFLQKKYPSFIIQNSQS